MDSLNVVDIFYNQNGFRLKVDEPLDRWLEWACPHMADSIQGGDQTVLSKVYLLVEGARNGWKLNYQLSLVKLII